MTPSTQKILIPIEVEAPEIGRWELVRYYNDGSKLGKDLQEHHLMIELRRVAPLETECDWMMFSNGIASMKKGFDRVHVLDDGTYRFVKTPTLAELRDLLKIKEYQETHGALPQTKKK